MRQKLALERKFEVRNVSSAFFLMFTHGNMASSWAKCSFLSTATANQSQSLQDLLLVSLYNGRSRRDRILENSLCGTRIKVISLAMAAMILWECRRCARRRMFLSTNSMSWVRPEEHLSYWLSDATGITLTLLIPDVSHVAKQLVRFSKCPDWTNHISASNVLFSFVVLSLVATALSRCRSPEPTCFLFWCEFVLLWVVILHFSICASADFGTELMS